MNFCNFNLMLMFLLPTASQECVIAIFDKLTKVLGINLFRRLFPVILTDNGAEFKNVLALEYTECGADRTNLFYCDPQASWQKPHIEKNHEFIRYVLPKRTPFDDLTQDSVTLLQNHINSFARDSLQGKHPFDAAKDFLGEKAINCLGLIRIPPDDVTLTPMLLRRKTGSDMQGTH
jgi:IS30 family transposase